MKNLFHFGDSYGTVKNYENNKHFCNHIADYLEMRYVSHAFGGLSNELIFSRILDNLQYIKKNDIIFINFSFFSRGCYYDETEKQIKSTNWLYNDIQKDKLYNEELYKNKKFINLVDYYIKHQIDYNFRLFRLIESTFNYLNQKGIKIFYIFVENSDYSNDLLHFGTQIYFENGFVNWLIKNKFHLGEDVHYTNGIQKMLADVLLRKTNNLKEDLKQNTISISINDIDKSKIERLSKII